MAEIQRRGISAWEIEETLWTNSPALNMCTRQCLKIRKNIHFEKICNGICIAMRSNNLHHILRHTVAGVVLVVE